MLSKNLLKRQRQTGIDTHFIANIRLQFSVIYRHVLR